HPDRALRQPGPGDAAREGGGDGDPLRHEPGGEVAGFGGSAEDEDVGHADCQPVMPPQPAHTTSLYREPVLEEILRRLAPTAAPDLTGAGALVVLALAAVRVGWWPAWRMLRLVVTLVHELGHAVVAVLSGRRFTGFVLRSDMSGHAVTVGPARGPGAVATAWAGYPAPALLGALAVWVSARGWAAPLLGLLLLGLLASLVRVRSALTALV